MLPSLLLGLAVLVGVILLTRWFATSPPSALATSAKVTAGLLLAAGAVLLIVSGRLGWALALIAGLIPWGLRLMRLAAAAMALRSTWYAMTGNRPSPGKASAVETRFLRMTLDHDSGELDGAVIAGPLAGRSLATLGYGEFAALWRLCQADTQSQQVLEAWRERCHPEWEAPAEEADGDGGAPSRAGGMTRDEAYHVLGLSPGASDAEIKAAHRRLMVKYHPDHGGTTYLAALINQAKDVLLGG